MSNQFIAHVEIPVTDLDQAKDFYEKVFGWDIKPFGKGYYLFNTRSGMTIGFRKTDIIQSGNTTIFHVNVDSIEAHLDRVKTSGGKVFREKTVIPVYGWYALLNDPDGNTIGLFQTH